MSTEMKTFTFGDIKRWMYCYAAEMYLDASWTGTALDILKHERMPAQNKLAIVIRDEVLDDKTLRLFAVSCARLVQYFNKDKRISNAIEVGERYAYAKATDFERIEARKEAESARRDAMLEFRWGANAAAGAAESCLWQSAALGAWSALSASLEAANLYYAEIESLRKHLVKQLIKMLEGR